MATKKSSTAKKSVPKAQLGKLIKKGIEVVSKTTPKISALAAAKAVPKVKYKVPEYKTPPLTQKDIEISRAMIQYDKDVLSAAKNPVKKVASELSPGVKNTVDNQYNKKGLKMAIERRANPAAANKKMTKAQRQSFEVDNSYQKNGGSIKKK